jgi:hypothetical protein
MDDYLLPVLGTIILLGATYYYFVVMAKPKKLASVPAPMVKKGTAAAAKRKPLKKKVEVRTGGRFWHHGQTHDFRTSASAV